MLQYINSWRLLEKAVLIEKAEKKHTYEDPGIYIAVIALMPLLRLQEQWCYPHYRL